MIRSSGQWSTVAMAIVQLGFQAPSNGPTPDAACIGGYLASSTSPEEDAFWFSWQTEMTIHRRGLMILGVPHLVLKVLTSLLMLT